MASPTPDKRLTPDEIDQIVNLRLQAVPVRRVATEVGVDKATVTKHFNRWLDQTTEERRSELERERSRVIARLQNIADEARRASNRARTSDDETTPTEQWAAEARFMNTERQALKDWSTVAGYDTAIKVATSFETMTEDEAAAGLAKLRR